MTHRLVQRQKQRITRTVVYKMTARGAHFYGPRQQIYTIALMKDIVIAYDE